MSTFVGTPSDQVFLGDYPYRLVMAYPRIDLWMHFQGIAVRVPASAPQALQSGGR